MGRGQDKKKAKWEKLLEVCSGARRPLILIYGDPDPDALASAFALRLLMQKAGVSPSIAYTGTVGRLENERMIKLLRIPVRKASEKMTRGADLTALVDAQPEFFKNTGEPGAHIVIDHHPKKSGRKFLFEDIRPDVMATSSIMFEHLTEAGITPDRRLSTALYYGIQTDGMLSEKNPSGTDLSAIAFLEENFDRAALRKIMLSSYSLCRLNYFSIALAKLHFSEGVIFSDIGPAPYAEICAQIADFLIRVKEASWAVVSGVVDKKLVVVFRCDGYKKSAGRTAEAAFGDIGSAGGHATKARAEIDEKALPMLLTQNEKIERFVVRRIAEKERAFRPLLDSLLV